MIDWITAILPCKHDMDKLSVGRLISLNKDGNIEWLCEKKNFVEGSFSSKIQIKSISDDAIWISGNPTKFLQGHNLFGSDDLLGLMFKFFQKLISIDELGLTPSIFDLRNIADGNYELFRVDINYSWELKNSSEVLSFVRAIGENAYLKHRGRGLLSGETAYFGKHSRRWALKCYSKGHEIGAKGHELPKELRLPEMLEYADKALRIEAVIRSKELKRLGLDVANAWDIDKPMELLLQYVSQLELSSVYMLKDDIFNSLPPRLKLTYQSWLDGNDLKSYLSKATFYRYRNELKKYGIDIATKSPNEKSNIIPLIRVLEAKPMGIPEWAYEKNLVA